MPHNSGLYKLTLLLHNQQAIYSAIEEITKWRDYVNRRPR